MEAKVFKEALVRRQLIIVYLKGKLVISVKRRWVIETDLSLKATEESVALETMLLVTGGIVQCDLDQDAIHMNCIEWYGRNDSIGWTFVKEFGLEPGAVAESIAHDAHNIMVIGTSLENMALAVNEIVRMDRGISAVCDGQVLGGLRLPIAGLMTDERRDNQLTQKIADMHQLVTSQLGYHYRLLPPLVE